MEVIAPGKASVKSLHGGRMSEVSEERQYSQVGDGGGGDRRGGSTAKWVTVEEVIGGAVQPSG
eukprot:161918-Chlamydomonas_euryale.AAC.1